MFVGEKDNETIANYMVMYVILINGECFFLYVQSRGISLCSFIHSHIKKNASIKVGLYPLVTVFLRDTYRCLAGTMFALKDSLELQYDLELVAYII
jgi:hypothetical protein